MHRFKEITATELENAIKLIGKDWMLITTADGDKANTMTASWGSMGVLWRKDVCTVFVRPQRYTYGLIEKEEKFSISFFDEKYRDALNFCGSHSGRDCDKFAETGLTTAKVDGTPVICESRFILICKKLYADDIKRENFISEEPLYTYEKNDFHRFYICEIEKVLARVQD